MKKIFSFVAAALVSATLFATPAVVPTVADLSTAGYDVINNYVIAIHPDEEVCNPIVWAGSYNTWTTNLNYMLQFQELTDFDGWYVVEFYDGSNSVQGKPVQLKLDGSFAWEYQAGDSSAWVNMNQPNTQTAIIIPGYDDEAQLELPTTGAYIYELAFWKKHQTPCIEKAKHNYTISAYLPDFCDAIAAYQDSVRLVGGFDNWNDGVKMKKKTDKDFRTYYYAELYAIEEGTEFKIRFGTDADWAVQVQKNFENLKNEMTGEEENIVLQFNGEGYGFAACNSLTNNVITYTATEKLEETKNTWESGLHTNAFNVEITSHDFSNGTGTITFAGEVTTIGSFAFHGCGLTSVTIPNSVTTIGNCAFLNCSGLTSIDVDVANTHYCSVDGVLFNYAKDTLIQYPAANTRTEYTIPNSVTTIGDYAFYGCSSLTSITIPNSVTTIGSFAFHGCTGLTSVTIPNSVTTIGNWAFAYCSGLISITIGNSVTTIGEGAFYGCSGLTSVTIPNSVTTIGEGAFYGCSGLTSVTIPNSVTTIGYRAFAECSGLTDVTVAWTSTGQQPTMGNDVFNGIANNVGPSGATLHVPAGTKAIYQAADQWKDFGTITTEQQSSTTNVITYTATEKLSETTDTNTFGLHTNAFNVAITSHEFSNGTGTITFAGEVTTIGDWAFYWCTSLTSITIPNSVTTIGDRAFEYCLGLTSPLYNATIFAYMPQSYKGAYTIPDGIEQIAGFAFYGCHDLTSVTIPNSVTTISKNAFVSCDKLTSPIYNATIFAYMPQSYKGAYTIPDGIEQIADGAFYDCSGLTSITIPHSVTTIGEDAFSVCYGLTSVTIPNSVTTIKSCAFLACSDLTSVTIPNSVTTIGDHAFSCCSGLTSIDVDAGNTHYCSIDGVLFNYARDSLIQYPIGNTRIEYTIPNSVTTIGMGAFELCTGLTSIAIPNSVITIGESAFDFCDGLTSVTIPNSVTTIGDAAFAECIGLTSVTCYAVTPPKCGDYVFEDVSQDAKVYVPASSLVDYQNARAWKDLQLYPIAANVTPMDDENPVVTPSDQDVTITWPITDGTDTYTLTITKNGEVVCVLTFNAQGQLVNIAFKAPAADGAHQAPAATLTAQGYQFTVTGLNPGTAYNYSVTATDAGGKTLAEHKGNFSTTGGGTPTSMDKVHGSQCTMHKVLRNGQLLIETNNATYTPMGQKVR